MELKKLSEHIWYMPYESERDRPNLGYVKGKNWSLAIDAGHSAAHTKEFYSLLEKEGLPLPSITVFTHWHWDHTFGMHAANGLSIANEKTNGHLAEWKDKIEKNDNRYGRTGKSKNGAEVSPGLFRRQTGTGCIPATRRGQRGKRDSAVG